AVDGDRVVVVGAGGAAPADAVAVLLVEEAGPQVGRVDDVGVGVEDLEPVSHGRTVPPWPSSWSTRSSGPTRTGAPAASSWPGARAASTRSTPSCPPATPSRRTATTATS